MTSRDERLTARERSFTCLFLLSLSLCCIFSSSSLQESFFRRGRATRFSSLFFFSRIAFENARVVLWINARLIESEISCFFQWRIHPTRLFHAFFFFVQLQQAAQTKSRITARKRKNRNSKGIRRIYTFLVLSQSGEIHTDRIAFPRLFNAPAIN